MKNRFQSNGDGTVTIFIKCQGKERGTLIDEDDLPKVMQIPLSIYGVDDGHTIYARLTPHTKGIPNFRDGTCVTAYLHQYLMNTVIGEEVDHINHDGLNNTRSNMRVVTTEENQENSCFPNRRKTGYHPYRDYERGCVGYVEKSDDFDELPF